MSLSYVYRNAVLMGPFSACQTEVEQLRKKVADLEMKSARQVHDVRCSFIPVQHRNSTALTWNNS